MKVESQELQQVLEENKALLQENRHLYSHITKLLKLQEFSIAVVSSLDLDEVCQHMVQFAMETMNARASRLYLIDEAAGDIVYKVGIGERLGNKKSRRIKPNEGIIGWVCTYGKATIVEDVSKDRRYTPGIDDPAGLSTKTITCLPLVAKGKTLGVLDVCDKMDGPFDQNDLEWLGVLAQQGATAIDNIRLFQNASEEKGRVLVLQEDLRKKLARDLHDGPAQALAAITMNIDYVKKLVSKNAANVAEELDSLRALSSRTMREVRTLLFELRPLMLETQGLVPTLQSLINRLQEPDGPVLRLCTTGDVEGLDKGLEMCVFSIVQEAINNTRKHAKAKNIWVKVAVQGKSLSVTVKDDGKGFDIDAVQANYENSGSLGLLNMRERASLAGGTLTLKSSLGHGTLVTIRLPLKQTASASNA